MLILAAITAPTPAPAPVPLDTALLLGRLAGVLEGPALEPRLTAHQDHPAVRLARRMSLVELLEHALEPASQGLFQVEARRFAALPEVREACRAACRADQEPRALDQTWVERRLGIPSPVLLASPFAPERPFAMPRPGAPQILLHPETRSDLVLALLLEPPLRHWTQRQGSRLRKVLPALTLSPADLEGVPARSEQQMLIDTLVQAFVIRYHLDHGDTDLGREAGRRAARQGLLWAEPLALHLQASGLMEPKATLLCQTPQILSFLQACAPRTRERLAQFRRTARP